MEQLSFTDLEIEIRKVGGYGLKLTNPCPAESKKARKFGLFYWKIMSVFVQYTYSITAAEKPMSQSETPIKTRIVRVKH